MRSPIPSLRPRRWRALRSATIRWRAFGTSPLARLVVAFAFAVTATAGPMARAEAAEPGAADAAGTHEGAIDLSPYAGKVVYVDFWASWCVPCRASFPWMNALQAELADDGLVIIGVNTGDTPDEAARFLEKVPAEFTLMEDPDGAIARAYGLTGMPMAFVHDRDGRLVASHVGFNERTADRHAEELRRFVREGP